MAGRGRPRLPSNVKRLRGTDRKDRRNDAEPEFEPSESLPPDDLDEDAAKCWRDLAPMLLGAGVLRESDRRALEMLCREWSVYRQAQRKLDSTGMLIKTPSGYPVQNPYVAIANRAFKNCQSMMSEFGLTPSARTKVAAGNADTPATGGRKGGSNRFADLPRS